MKPTAEFDIIVYGASGYTGRLVAEFLAQRYGVGGEVKWAMAGRSHAKLAEVRDLIGASKDTPLVVADATNPASLTAMAARTKAVVTTVGPYQLYGEPLLAACAATGTDYLDLCGEVNWMRQMIVAHDATAKRTGARICLSCGFDSIPFELGVFFAEETAKERFGAVAPRVKGRVRGMQGGMSGGTAASVAAIMAAVHADPSVMAVLHDPFSLTPGFQGAPQPPADTPEFDEDLGAEVGPLAMAMINTKNVHRSNFLMGHPYGRDFVYDEMSVIIPGALTDISDISQTSLRPGDGPTKEERENGFYDIAFVAIAADGRKVRVAVKGDMDGGYGSASKMLAEASLCLVKDCPGTPGGVWTPGAAMRGALLERLQRNAGLSFSVEN